MITAHLYRVRIKQRRRRLSYSVFDLFQMSKAELEDLFLFVVLSEGQSDSEVKELSLNVHNFNKTGDSKLTAEVRWVSGRGLSRCR